MTLDDIGTTFVRNSGLASWAESNNIVLLFPQAIKADVPVNPKGCWDWWGYSGADYATRFGPQMATVHTMAEALMGH